MHPKMAENAVMAMDCPDLCCREQQFSGWRHLWGRPPGLPVAGCSAPAAEAEPSRPAGRRTAPPWRNTVASYRTAAGAQNKVAC